MVLALVPKTPPFQDEEEEEEDYIDSDDEREEGEKAPHENAFVYIDDSGKLVYINPDEEDGDEGEGEGAAGLEEKEEQVTLTHGMSLSFILLFVSFNSNVVVNIPFVRVNKHTTVAL